MMKILFVDVKSKFYGVKFVCDLKLKRYKGNVI